MSQQAQAVSEKETAALARIDQFALELDIALRNLMDMPTDDLDSVPLELVEAIMTQFVVVQQAAHFCRCVNARFNPENLERISQDNRRLQRQLDLQIANGLEFFAPFYEGDAPRH